MEHKYLTGNKTQCSMNNQNPESDPGVKDEDQRSRAVSP